MFLHPSHLQMWYLMDVFGLCYNIFCKHVGDPATVRFLVKKRLNCWNSSGYTLNNSTQYYIIDFEWSVCEFFSFWNKSSNGDESGLESYCPIVPPAGIVLSIHFGSKKNYTRYICYHSFGLKQTNVHIITHIPLFIWKAKLWHPEDGIILFFSLSLNRIDAKFA